MLIQKANETSKTKVPIQTLSKIISTSDQKESARIIDRYSQGLYRLKNKKIK